MPHIAGYIKEALEEEKYADEFNSRIGVRVQEMNTAQLQAMFDALNATAKDSGFKPWGDANKTLSAEIEKVLIVRIAEDKQEEKRLQTIKDRENRARENERMKRLEKKRVLRMIKENAMSSASKFVKEAENERKIAERVNMVHVVAEAETRAMKIVGATLAFLVVGIIGVALIVSNPLVSGSAIGGLFVLSFGMCFYAYKVTDIEPLVVTQEELDEQIEEKEDELIEDAMEVLRQQEIAFKKKVKNERKERKRAVRELKEKRRRDAEAALEKAAEVAAMAADLAADDVYVPTTDEQRRAELIAAEEAENRSVSESESSDSDSDSDNDSNNDSGGDSGGELDDENKEDKEEEEEGGDEVGRLGSPASGSAVNSKVHSRPSSAGKSSSNSNSNSTPTTPTGRSGGGVGFAGIGRRLSSKFFSTSSQDLVGAGVSKGGTGGLSRQPSFLENLVSSVMPSRTNSTVEPTSTAAAAAAAAARYVDGTVSVSNKDGTIDRAEESSLPLPATKPPLFTKMVSRLSMKNLLSGGDGGADKDKDKYHGDEEEAGRYGTGSRAGSGKEDRAVDPQKNNSKKAKAKGSRFSLFGRKEKKEEEKEEVVVDHSPVTLEDILRVLPISVQCIDMKETISKDALIMVSVQDVPYVYNYQAQQFKKAANRAGKRFSSITTSGGATGTAAAAAVNHGFSRPGTVTSNLNNNNNNFSAGAYGDEFSASSASAGVTAGAMTATESLAAVSVPEVILPPPKVPKYWPITDRAYKSRSLERLMDDVDTALLTAQYAITEKHDGADGDGGEDSDEDDPTGAHSRPRSAANNKPKPVMFDGKPLPELTAQQTEYLKDKIEIPPNYARRVLDAKTAEIGGEKEILSTGVVYTVLDDAFEDLDNDPFYAPSAEKKHSHHHHHHHQQQQQQQRGSGNNSNNNSYTAAEDRPTSASASGSYSTAAMALARPSGGSFTAVKAATPVRHHSHHLHSHHQVRSISHEIIHKNISHANAQRKGVISTSSYITVAIYLPMKSLSPFLQHNFQSMVNMYLRREDQLISQYVQQLKAATARYLRHLGPDAPTIETTATAAAGSEAVVPGAVGTKEELLPKKWVAPAESSKIVLEKGTSAIVAMKKLSSMFSHAPVKPIEDANRAIKRAASIRVRTIAVRPTSAEGDVDEMSESANVKSVSTSVSTGTYRLGSCTAEAAEKLALDAKLMPVYPQATHLATLSRLTVQLANTAAKDAALRKRHGYARSAGAMSPADLEGVRATATSPSVLSDSEVMSESTASVVFTGMGDSALSDQGQGYGGGGVGGDKPAVESPVAAKSDTKKKKKKNKKQEEEAARAAAAAVAKKAGQLPISPKTPAGAPVPPPAAHLLAPPLTLDHTDCYPHQAYKCMGYINIYLSDFLPTAPHDGDGDGEEKKEKGGKDTVWPPQVGSGLGRPVTGDGSIAVAAEVQEQEQRPVSAVAPVVAAFASSYVNPEILPIYDTDKGNKKEFRGQEVVPIKYKTENTHGHGHGHGKRHSLTRPGDSHSSAAGVLDALAHVSSKGPDFDHGAAGTAAAASTSRPISPSLQHSSDGGDDCIHHGAAGTAATATASVPHVKEGVLVSTKSFYSLVGVPVCSSIAIELKYSSLNVINIASGASASADHKAIKKKKTTRKSVDYTTVITGGGGGTKSPVSSRSARNSLIERTSSPVIPEHPKLLERSPFENIL